MRFRLYPTAEQEARLTECCAHSRYVWNLAVELLSYSTPGRPAPGWNEQSRQLTEARQEFEWLRCAPSTVHHQALRDFHQACINWSRGTHRRPRWHKKGRHEGFRVQDSKGVRVEHLSGRWSQVRVPLIGWIKLRRTRDIQDVRSFRVTRDSTGRWHVAFPVKPEPVDGPGISEVVGVDRGVAVTLTFSDGCMLRAPTPSSIRTASQALSRRKRGSNRRLKAKTRLARIHARNADRRKDFIEKSTTHLAKNYDLIRIEDLKVANMTRSARGTVEQPGTNVRQKSGLNRVILAGGWSMFARRLEDKAPGRVEKVNPRFTSQRCSVCQHVDAKSRKSQALFECTACGHTSNADLNAAKNIAAGRAVRGVENLSALKRVPQLAPAA